MFGKSCGHLPAIAGTCPQGRASYVQLEKIIYFLLFTKTNSFFVLFLIQLVGNCCPLFHYFDVPASFTRDDDVVVRYM